MTKTVILRKEIKEGEQRTPITPKDAKLILENGITLKVESCSNRIFKDNEYKNIGCEIIPSESWKSAPEDNIILGLKELPDEESPLNHNHIYFAHIYKNQGHAEKTLKRFKVGGGKLYDLEYLTHENNHRVAAFGHFAGFVGAGLGLKAIYDNGNLSPLSHFSSRDEFISSIKKSANSNKTKVLIIGGKGRCGQGAIELLNNFNVDCTLWDREETVTPGPYKKILNFDFLINCVLVSKKIPPFLNMETLKENTKLKVISDVSCDPGPNNPLPLYTKESTWKDPLHKVNNVSILAVDNLPSLLPRESSIEFSSQLTPHLLYFLKGQDINGPFSRALNIFNSKF